MAKMVYVDPKLIAGENLRYAVFVKELDGRWVLQSAAPETHHQAKRLRNIIIRASLKTCHNVQLHIIHRNEQNRHRAVRPDLAHEINM